MGVIILNVNSPSSVSVLNPFLAAQQYLRYTESLADALEKKMDRGEELTLKMLEDVSRDCEGYERFSMLDDCYLLLKMVWEHGDKIISIWDNYRRGREEQLFHPIKHRLGSLFATRP